VTLFLFILYKLFWLVCPYCQIYINYCIYYLVLGVPLRYFYHGVLGSVFFCTNKALVRDVLLKMSCKVQKLQIGLELAQHVDEKLNIVLLTNST
jgi:hypothetical protein